MADVNEVLKLIKGSTQSFEFLVFDENDQPANLSTFDKATLALREEEGGSTLLLRRTEDSNLSINVGAAKLVATLTQAEADALKPGGLLIADVALRVPVALTWVHLDRVKVKVLNSFAPHTPST